LNTYKRFKILLSHHGIEKIKNFSSLEDLDENSTDFLEFCALHFPKSKVIELFKEVDYENIKRQLKNRENTSLKGFIELAKINKCLFDVIKLLNCEASTILNSKAGSIINSFLSNEMDFYQS